MISGGNKAPRRRHRSRLDTIDFESFLPCGSFTVCCAGVFLLFYAILMFGLVPLLQMDDDSGKFLDSRHALDTAKKTVKDRLSNVVKRKGSAAHLDHLLREAEVEFEDQRRRRKQDAARAVLRAGDDDAVSYPQQEPEEGEWENGVRKKNKKKKQQEEDVPTVGVDGKNRDGFIVLGMHRSGTSMLSGLLVNGMGYNVGKPLIGPAFDNKKGFFEQVDIVLQNDEFMNIQGVWWSNKVLKYDAELALKHKKDGTIKFKKGKQGLVFLNDSKNAPWLQKDPRMCITLRSWLPLLKTEPAVIFTYRHPLEVAGSLKKREQGFTLEKGLRLWTAYNMKAIQNSQDLCRVFSSNDAVLANPQKEVQRISDKLTTKCGVPPPPHSLSKEVVDDFIDPTLQHQKKAGFDTSPEGAKASGRTVLATHSNGECVVTEYDTSTKEGSPEWKRERDAYLVAMKILCDLKSKAAYQPDYEWPTDV